MRNGYVASAPLANPAGVFRRPQIRHGLYFSLCLDQVAHQGAVKFKKRLRHEAFGATPAISGQAGGFPAGQQRMRVAECKV